MNKRVRFSVGGYHPLLGLVRDYFIAQGLALVPWDVSPDFCLIGAEISEDSYPSFPQVELAAMQAQEVPVLLLSSSLVYQGCSSKQVVKESSAALTVPTVNSVSLGPPLYSLVAEHTFSRREAPTAVVRPFFVYGHEVRKGVVHDLIGQARRGEAPSFPAPGYLTSSFLHQDDFLEAVNRLRKRLLKGHGGVFNVASPEVVSLFRLADSVWQLTCGTSAPRVPGGGNALVRAPDVRKLKEIVGWAPKYTLRRGLFEVINGSDS